MTDENRKARDAKKAAYLHALHDRYTRHFRAFGEQVSPSVAREMHEAMDAVLKHERELSATSGEIRCAKGCSHCCRGPVEIWPHEAALLADTVRAAGMELDSARLERQARHTADNWREQPPADRACVFLGDDGACRVYESRPNACRKLLVVSDPALCEADKHPPESVARWFSWEGEMMEVAALEVFGAALMPRLLAGLLSK
jgi:hypothetical protein